MCQDAEVYRRPTSHERNRSRDLRSLGRVYMGSMVNVRPGK